MGHTCEGSELKSKLKENKLATRIRHPSNLQPYKPLLKIDVDLFLLFVVHQ